VENRKNNRKIMQIGVRLYIEGTFITLATTQDVAEGGVFINTDVLRFPKNIHLNVVFDSSNYKKGERQQIPAKVVHRCLNGIGIKFTDTILPSNANQWIDGLSGAV